MLVTPCLGYHAWGLQRDVVGLCWPIAPSNTSPNAGELGGLQGSQPISAAVHITWHGAKINFGDPYLTYAPSKYLLFVVLSVSWEERPAQGPAGQPQEAGPEVRRRAVPNLSHAPPLPGRPHKPFTPRGLGYRGGGGRRWTFSALPHKYLWFLSCSQ